MCKHRDHAGMIYVPAGEFVMGTDSAWLRPNERPERREFSAGFWMDAALVTNRDFEQFIPNHVRSLSSPDDDMPVVDVTWWEAFLYCRSLGKRLPSEKEWEKAARGPAGLAYPYGNTFDPALANVWPGVGRATPVGAYPPNSYGLYDMSGNVLQFTRDIYRLREFRFVIVKGGSWGTCRKGARSFTRVVHDPGIRNNRLGFRCACSGGRNNAAKNHQ